MQDILSQEGYVPVENKDALKYKTMYLIKEEIRKHKWNKGTEGVDLSWEEAVSEWMSLHYDDFISFIKKMNKPKISRRFRADNTESIQKPFHIGV